MALDLNRVRTSYQQVAEQASKPKGNFDSVFWKPDSGEYVIRIVPYKYDMSYPFIELKQYYIFGKPITSPLTYGDIDPVDQFSHELINKPGATKDERDLGYKLRPKDRVAVPILVRGRETEGIKFWTFGATVYQSLLKIMNTPDYGDITDLVAGHDLDITIKRGKTFQESETTVLPKPSKTKIYNDESLIISLLEKTPDFLNSVVVRKTPDEMVKILEEYLTRLSNTPNTQEMKQGPGPLTTSYSFQTPTPTQSPQPSKFTAFGQPQVDQADNTTAEVTSTGNGDIKSKFQSLFGGQK